MHYWVKMTDRTEKFHVREEHKEEHVKYLDGHPQILLAGPLFAENAEKPSAGGWVIEARNPAEARRVIEADPYYRNGLRDTVEITRWDIAVSKMNADGKRP